MSNLVQSLISFLSAYILTSSVFIALIENNISESLQKILVGGIIALTSIIAFLSIITNKRKLISFFKVIIVLSLLYCYQRYIDFDNSGSEFYNTFFIHGIGGFCIALSIDHIQKTLKYIGFFSCLYLTILIVEPMTNNLMHKDEMVTGYLMTSLVIFLILYYFQYKKSIIVLYLAIISSVTVTLFTSRGCGLSICLAWITFYLIKQVQCGKSYSRTLSKIMIMVSLSIIIIFVLADNLYNSGTDIQKGSLIEKIANGYISESNGREEIWGITENLKSDALTFGIGMGKDRILGNYIFVHNIILELILNFGIPFAIIILLIYWIPVIRFITKHPYDLTSSFILALIIRYWVQLMFSSSYLDSMFGLMFIIGLAHNHIYSKFMICPSGKPSI